jgi:hypothetical protein
MYTPKLELLSFSTLPVQRKQIVLRALLECLIVADWNYILEHPDLPSLYEFAPKYVLKVRPGGLDSWQDIAQTIALGSADCKDLACWRIAELRNAGYDDVYPHIKVSYHQDPAGRDPVMTVYHIQVRIHDIIEDPSAILGMPKHVSYDQLRNGDPNQAAAAGAFQHFSPHFNPGGFMPQMPFMPDYGPMPDFGGAQPLIIQG